MISGLIITHEIGDGQNDYVLHKVLLDAIARDRLLHDVGYYNSIFHELFGYRDYFYNQNIDPMLFVELRNQGYITSNTQSRMIDLVPRNMRGRLSRAQNPFISPSNTPFGNTGIEINSSSEAITLLAPMDAKFRRMRIRFASEVVAKVYGIQVQARVAVRRFQ